MEEVVAYKIQKKMQAKLKKAKDNKKKIEAFHSEKNLKTYDTNAKSIRIVSLILFLVPALLGFLSTPLIFFSLFLLAAPTLIKIGYKIAALIESRRIKKLAAKLSDFNKKYIDSVEARHGFIEERLKKMEADKEQAKFEEDKKQVREVDARVADFTDEELLKQQEEEKKLKEQIQKEEQEAKKKGKPKEKNKERVLTPEEIKKEQFTL